MFLSRAMRSIPPTNFFASYLAGSRGALVAGSLHSADRPVVGRSACPLSGQVERRFVGLAPVLAGSGAAHSPAGSVGETAADLPVGSVERLGSLAGLLAGFVGELANLAERLGSAAGSPVGLVGESGNLAERLGSVVGSPVGLVGEPGNLAERLGSAAGPSVDLGASFPVGFRQMSFAIPPFPHWTGDLACTVRIRYLHPLSPSCG